MPRQVITRQSGGPVPFSLDLGALDTITPSAAFAHFNGAAASGSFLPCITYYTQDGLVFARAFPATAVAAGASADVSWFPGLTSSPAGTSTGGGTRTVPVFMVSPDSGSGGAYPAYTGNFGFTVAKLIVPGFVNGVDSNWHGSVRVPADYASGGTIVCSWAATATSGNLRNRVGTAVVAAGVSEDTAYTAETYVNTPAAGTARVRFDSTFVLSTTLAAGADLNVVVTRNGSSGSDSMASDALLWRVALTYTAS